MLYLFFFKPLRDHLRGFLIAAWAGDKIAEFSFPEISFHFPLRPWFFFVSPAYAGKRQFCPPAGRTDKDHPRMCGEKMMKAGSNCAMLGSPPRMRGKVINNINSWLIVGITPAYAGKRAKKPVVQDDDMDHPRVCGEKRRPRFRHCLRPGSPPRMRGKARHGCVMEPAKWDHPRVCGEKTKKIP